MKNNVTLIFDFSNIISAYSLFPDAKRRLALTLLRFKPQSAKVGHDAEQAIVTKHRHGGNRPQLVSYFIFFAAMLLR